MNKKTKQAVLITLFLTFLTLVAITNAQTGGGYDLTWSTIDGGGSSSSGGDFLLKGTIGQPDAGALSGGDYTLNGGFWQCVTTAVVSPGITINGTDINLNWISAAPTANVYRATNNPYFTPGTAQATGVSSIWTDPGAAGNPVSNYTYIIRASGNCGESANSQRLAEFDFALTPGS